MSSLSINQELMGKILKCNPYGILLHKKVIGRVVNVTLFGLLLNREPIEYNGSLCIQSVANLYQVFIPEEKGLMKEIFKLDQNNII